MAGDLSGGGEVGPAYPSPSSGRVPPKGYEGVRSVEPNGTGFGKQIEKKSEVVTRTFGPLAATITIRYNK